MPFENLMPYGFVKPGVRSAVVISAVILPPVRGMGKKGSRTVLTFRTGFMEKKPAFLKFNAKVTAQFGTGVDAGYLRLIAGSISVIKYAGGGQSTEGGERALCLMLAPLPWLPLGNYRRSPCEFVVNDDGSMIIDLPDWAIPKASANAVPAAQAGAPNGPYKMGAPSHVEVLKGRGVPGA
jgi:hypothetical protein